MSIENEVKEVERMLGIFYAHYGLRKDESVKSIVDEAKKNSRITPLIKALSMFENNTTAMSDGASLLETKSETFLWSAQQDLFRWFANTSVRKGAPAGVDFDVVLAQLETIKYSEIEENSEIAEAFRGITEAPARRRGIE